MSLELRSHEANGCLFSLFCLDFLLFCSNAFYPSLEEVVTLLYSDNFTFFLLILILRMNFIFIKMRRYMLIFPWPCGKPKLTFFNWFMLVKTIFLL